MGINVKNLALSVFLPGINRLAKDCWGTGFMKLVSPLIPVVGIPIAVSWYFVDIGYAVAGSDGYPKCRNKKESKPTSPKVVSPPKMKRTKVVPVKGGGKTRSRRRKSGRHSRRRRRK